MKRFIPFLITAISFAIPAVLFAQTGDANYRALREAAPADSFLLENVELSRDVAKFSFKNGTLTFLAAVQGRAMLAVFRGEATFDLTPANEVDRKSLTH